MVFAIDGSKGEVPNSDENKVAFGKCGIQHSKGEVSALASCMFDVFNHFFLDLQIDSMKQSKVNWQNKIWKLLIEVWEYYWKSTLYVYQDFWAQIGEYNIIQDVLMHQMRK